MDELIEEKLRAMGYKEVPAELASMIAECRRKQNAVWPGPVSLDVIIVCTMLYEQRRAKKKAEG